MSQNSLNNYCNQCRKKELPYLQNVDKFALTNSLYALDAAFQKFFAKKAGYPKFKSKRNCCDSYTTNSTNNNIEIALATNSKSHKGKVKLPKLGWVDACNAICEDPIGNSTFCKDGPRGKQYFQFVEGLGVISYQESCV